MKLYKRKIRRSTLWVIGATMCITLSVIVNSCKKPGITVENFESSNLRVINGLTAPPDVKFYLDSFNLTLTGTVNYGAATPYWVVKSGLRHASFYSSALDDAFATKDIQLDSKKIYTLFIADTIGSPKYFLTEDNLSVPPSADQAKIRLANLAKTGGNIDVTIQLEDTISLPQPKPEVSVYTNVAPQTISDYTLITVPTTKGNTSPQPHTFRVYEAGTNNLLAIGGGDLRGPATYTIIVTGIKDAVGTYALGISSSLEWLDW